MILQSFRMAFASIVANKMRSFLTMLGIIIGIMAVVVLVSIVGGATDSVAGELNSLGAETLSVTVTSSRYQPLSVDDVISLSDEYESIGYAAPTTTQNATLKAGDTNATASVVGTTAA